MPIFKVITNKRIGGLERIKKVNSHTLYLQPEKVNQKMKLQPIPSTLAKKIDSQ